MHGRANGIATKTRRVYGEAFPNRQIPSHTTLFVKIRQRLRGTALLSKQLYLF